MIWLRIGTSGGLLNTVVKLRVPKTFEKFLSSFTAGSFSRMAQLHEVK
jgi:hypothetical protein